MRGGREVRPCRLEGVYAFRPRAHQDSVRTVLAAFGVADRQSVNRDCLRVNQGAHRHSLSGGTVCRSETTVPSSFSIAILSGVNIVVAPKNGSIRVCSNPRPCYVDVFPQIGFRVGRGSMATTSSREPDTTRPSSLQLLPYPRLRFDESVYQMT